MAQWADQETGKTPASRVEDAERALAHAVDVLRSAPSPKDQKVLKSIIHLAKRVLSARTQVLKTRVGGSRLQRKVNDLQSSGVAGILAEFGVGELTVVPRGKVPGE